MRTLMVGGSRHREWLELDRNTFRPGDTVRVVKPVVGYSPDPEFETENYTLERFRAWGGPFPVELLILVAQGTGARDAYALHAMLLELGGEEVR